MDILFKNDDFVFSYRVGGILIRNGKHWIDENLKSPAKPVNAPLIKEYTGGRITKVEQTRFMRLWNMLLRRITKI